MSEGRIPDVTVLGYAMWTAAGHDGPSTVASMRARVSGAEVGNLFDTRSGEALKSCRVHAHQWWEGSSFLPHMIAPVLTDCLDLLREMNLRTDVPVFINVAPSERPGREPDLEQQVLKGLKSLLAGDLPTGSRVVAGGRAGIPIVLASVAESRAPVAIVIGAESFLRQQVVRHYADRRRLLTADNSSGFIAGEAAAAVILARGRQKGLTLTGMGSAMEDSRDGGSKETPVKGEGLTEAMRKALSVSRSSYFDVSTVLGDLNGEHFKFKELAFATMRLDRVPPDGVSHRPRGHVEHWNVVETIGEVGAALMPAAMGWAFEAGKGGWLPGRVMFTAGEDDGRRVAVLGEWQDE